MDDKNLDKRQAILQAALQLISENGFHGTPMSLVAKEAAVGVGTIYRYFANKEELINELYKEVKINVTAAMLAGYREDLPIRERFVRICTNLVHYFLEHPMEMRFIEQYANSPFITTVTKQENARLFQPISSFFRYAQQQQIIKDMPLEILSALVYGMMMALVKLPNELNFRVDEAALETGITAAWDAIKR